MTYTRLTGAPKEPEVALLEVAEELNALRARIVGRPSLFIDLKIDERDDAPLVLSADPRLFRRAMRNLATNAVRYAESRVLIEAKRDAGGVTLAVEDDGPGLAVSDRTRIFEPFSRLDQSRARASGGVGLGLAIVCRIIDAHGGSVRTEDPKTLSGARFVTVWSDPPAS